MKYWSDTQLLNIYVFVLICWSSLLWACLLDLHLVAVWCHWSRSDQYQTSEKNHQPSLSNSCGLSTKPLLKKRSTSIQMMTKCKKMRSIWLLDHHTLVHTRRIFDFCCVDSFNAPWVLKSIKSDLHWDWSKKTITTIISNVEIIWKSQAVHRAHYRWTHTHNRQISQKYRRYESSWTFSMWCSQQKFYVVVFIGAMWYFSEKNGENRVPGTATAC